MFDALKGIMTDNNKGNDAGSVLTNAEAKHKKVETTNSEAIVKAQGGGTKNSSDILNLTTWF